MLRTLADRMEAGELSDEEQDECFHTWTLVAREDQKPPPEPWQFWLFLAGRGAGKTRAGVEWVRHKVKSGCGFGALIAPTAADARDVMVEGPAGVMEHCWAQDQTYSGTFIGKPSYEPSKRRLTWQNGASAALFSGEESDRLRGPQHDFLWCDELAAWWHPEEAWDMAMFGLRLGSNPQAFISTTPRPIPIIRELVASATCQVTRATTFANRANLAGTFYTHIIAKYQGTSLGRQELLGQVVEESENALWTRALVEATHDGKHAAPIRTVVAVDPAVTAHPTSNLTGIIVAARGADGRGYVLQDLSGRYNPDAWARVAIDALDRHKGDRIVAEGNQGGDLVRHTLQTVRANIPISIVHASQSKQARAEPVAALYEQHRITHCQPFPQLEDQLCTWEPLSGEASPDRLDALVWALTNLFLRGQEPPKFVPAYVVGRPRNIPGQ